MSSHLYKQITFPLLFGPNLNTACSPQSLSPPRTCRRMSTETSIKYLTRCMTSGFDKFEETRIKITMGLS